MTQRLEHLDLVLDELIRYGLRGEVSDRGKHLEIAWTSPVGRRFVIAPRTPSDWRSSMNLRSDLRKLLRADNLQPKVISELSFQKAMSLPKATPSAEHILQKDVEALTDLIFDLQAQVLALQQQNTLLQDKMNSATVVSKIEFAGKAKPEDADLVLQVERRLYNGVKAPPKQTKLDLVLSLMTTQFGPVSDLVKSSGLKRVHLGNVLHKAKAAGLVENGLRGLWRKKPI